MLYLLFNVLTFQISYIIVFQWYKVNVYRIGKECDIY